MEVGAVKQAFNNEVILLKKKLNQAKIQIIHKLTRKAKTLTEKKVPENIKLKFTKKAESAVKEVLIIKKIKARDIARFIVTHKGQLNEYLNRPTVDTDKACARLLLHKALQDKYKLLRDKFSNIPIKDLLMSCQERLKLKKEEKDKQKNKRKNKDSKKPVQAKGDWDVEDMNMEKSPLDPTDKDKESSADEHEQDVESSADEHDQHNDNEDDDDDESDEDDKSEESVSDVISKRNILLKDNVISSDTDGFNKESGESIDEDESDNESEKPDDVEKSGDEFKESSNDESIGKFVKSASCLPNDNIKTHKNDLLQDVKLKESNNKKNVEKKHKDHNRNKNKNLKNKILLNKFNKEKSEMPQETKIVDPFFITATGENYMSIAEPRPPDEVKEEHNQGNRKYRRAVMFGHVPKAKQRRNAYNPDSNNSRFSKFDDNNGRGNFNSSFKSNGFDKYGPQKRFEDSTDNNMGNFKNRQANNFKKNVEEESKPEKLHPSWEAKKRQSGILPFQGKKIVFDEG